MEKKGEILVNTNIKNMGDLYEKISDIYMKISKKFDFISEKIYEQTGKKINVGVIVGAVILLFLLFIIVKSVLGVIMKFLYTGTM